MTFISNDEINSIRAKADIVDVVGSYLSLTQKGKNYICVCPFHDDHSPSMSISQEKQIYKCFACGATGNVFTFIENYENVSFIDAVAIVANKCGIQLSSKNYNYKHINDTQKEEYKIMELVEKFYVNNLKTAVGKKALSYLNSRGINEDIINEFGIGLSLDENDSLLKLLTKKKYDVDKLVAIGLINNSNSRTYDVFTRRITFPLSDKDGNIVGFSARVYRGEKDVSKYMNSKESVIFKKGETLYNYNKAKDFAKREKQIIVVEGFMDVIRLVANGVKNVVALCGTAMTKEQMILLKKLRCSVILCLDNDSAGLLSTVNNGDELIKNNIETFVIRLTGQKDPDEYVLQNGIDAFLTNIRNPVTFFEFKMNYLKKDKNLSKVEDLSEYVNLILANLKNSDDDIFKEITLKKISDEYGLSLDVLKNKLDELSLNYQKKKIEIKPLIEKEKKLPSITNVERILYFMMNGAEYIKEYQKKLGYLDDSLYRQISNEIVYYEQKNNGINVADFITYASRNEEIKDKVMSIVNDSDGEEISIEIMDDYIEAVKKFSIKDEIKKLKKQLKNELDVEQKMKIAMQLAELKKDVF